MATSGRIYRKIPEFVAQMVNTDNLQTSILTPPAIKRFTLWGWSAEESAAWTAFREEAEDLFALYSDPDKVTSTIRQEMKDVIVRVNKYDHDPTEGHKLFDRVALLGTLGDCQTFNVKRTTTLAKIPMHGTGDPMLLIPRTSVRSIVKGGHALDIDEPTMPDVKGKFKGILAILVFCYIGAAPPTNPNQYVLIGAAIRGRFINSLNSGELSGSVKLFAYYCARYLTTTGQLGNLGNVAVADVVI